MKALKTSILAVVFSTFSMGATAQQNWPEAIAIPPGFEAEGIELGKGHEFFLGGFSFSSFFGEPFFGIPHEMSELAGAIYKGNLRTGEGAILALPTGKPVSGLSYDPRTDYLYAATGFGDLVNGSFTDQGVIVYDASSGDVIMEIGFGDGIALNDVLVTRRGVYVTDSLNPDLYKLVLEKGGRLPSAPVFEVITMPGFEMDDEFPGFNANGLVGKFDGKQLVIVNIATGVLYRVDTASGEASPLEIEGAEQLFPDGDGLYLDGRTLYIMQNFSDKIAVVQLLGDLSGGEFIRNIPGEGEINPLNIATTIIGFGNSLYAINTNFFDPSGPIFGNPAEVQAEVVRLKIHQQGAKAIGDAPVAYTLDQNKPNPFNPNTQIAYQLAEAGKIRLVVYNLTGQQIRVLDQGYRTAGHYQVTWDGRNEAGQAVSSGVYLYQFTSGAFTQTNRMLLLK